MIFFVKNNIIYQNINCNDFNDILLIHEILDDYITTTNISLEDQKQYKILVEKYYKNDFQLNMDQIKLYNKQMLYDNDDNKNNENKDEQQRIETMYYCVEYIKYFLKKHENDVKFKTNMKGIYEYIFLYFNFKY